ncbi:hypothetical protein QAD02_003662 [Eretmocerus hayati]|uniref:Uncharacterized protein n=1 Tax=Eretmocerus hayati TaxID=131215 RepID=A0ACC2NNF9_9HYME|nr:hypothetical protein QAD02_003662 [Eretmocerus hayati]
MLRDRNKLEIVEDHPKNTVQAAEQAQRYSEAVLNLKTEHKNREKRDSGVSFPNFEKWYHSSPSQKKPSINQYSHCRLIVETLDVCISKLLDAGSTRDIWHELCTIILEQLQFKDDTIKKYQKRIKTTFTTYLNWFIGEVLRHIVKSSQSRNSKDEGVRDRHNNDDATQINRKEGEPDFAPFPVHHIVNVAEALQVQGEENVIEVQDHGFELADPTNGDITTPDVSHQVTTSAERTEMKPESLTEVLEVKNEESVLKPRSQQRKDPSTQAKRMIESNESTEVEYSGESEKQKRGKNEFVAYHKFYFRDVKNEDYVTIVAFCKHSDCTWFKFISRKLICEPYEDVEMETLQDGPDGGVHARGEKHRRFITGPKRQEWAKN